MEEQKNCKTRVGKHLKGRIDDINKLWTAYRNGEEGEVEDIGRFEEYGLCFDYVAPGTFGKQRKGYFRYQLSWGGPSDEFRFYTGPEFEPYRIEYWFMDWFDGAQRILKGKNLDLMLEIFEDFKQCGTVEHVFNEATKE